MEYNLIINQAALRRWAGKINLKDAAIIGFIRGLSPDDPCVARYMRSGYYRLQLSWMLREIPLLDITEDWLSRRLKYLKNVGLLDTISIVDRGHQYKLYGRLSKLYFQEEEKWRKRLDRGDEGARSEKTPMGENSELGENSRRSLVQTPPEFSPIDHKNDHEEGAGVAPPKGAVSGPEEERDLPAEAFERMRREIRGRSAAQPQLPGLSGLDPNGTEPTPPGENEGGGAV